MADIVVGVQAYCKLLLHAAKYPHCAVNGVLLAEDSKSKDHKTIRFLDCIPLFHLSLGLAPMLEIALLQIDAFCRSKGYVIAGYYQANENFDDNQLSFVAKTVGKKIQEYFPDACIFQIDNGRVTPESVQEVYRVYTMKDNNWKEADKSKSTSEEDTRSTAAELLRSGAQRKVVDFDNHLDNVTNDWRNPELSELIATYI
ncbi:ER membrane protein complex subunit 8-like [Babylonia areolata]|uniref:ER membrane protein complex subunit 8-like n=1 Tax=Babylonia areolata TaxID=304850 RepID=UPI003FD4C49D